MKKLLLTAALLWTVPLWASPTMPFVDYVQTLKQEARAQGISPATIDASFADVRFIERAVKNDRNQPEFKLTLDSYLPQAVPEWKVRQAQRLYRKHYALLQRIGAWFGALPAKAADRLPVRVGGMEYR